MKKIPFYTQPRKMITTYPEGYPVDVIATTNLLGKIRIDYIVFKNDHSERYTYKVSYSHLRKAYENLETYDCEYINNGVQYYITLMFDVLNQSWVLDTS